MSLPTKLQLFRTRQKNNGSIRLVFRMQRKGNHSFEQGNEGVLQVGSNGRSLIEAKKQENYGLKRKIKIQSSYIK